jgi:hypothetical protein
VEFLVLSLCVLLYFLSLSHRSSFSSPSPVSAVVTAPSNVNGPSRHLVFFASRRRSAADYDSHRFNVVLTSPSSSSRRRCGTRRRRRGIVIASLPLPHFHYHALLTLIRPRERDDETMAFLLSNGRTADARSRTTKRSVERS